MKMKKLVALISAGVLCLSMSMTAFVQRTRETLKRQRFRQKSGRMEAGRT